MTNIKDFEEQLDIVERLIHTECNSIFVSEALKEEHQSDSNISKHIAKEFLYLRITWFELKVNSCMIRNLIKFNADEYYRRLN